MKIEEVERFGKELFSYSVHEEISNDREDEPMYESVYAGDAVVYEYAGQQYEVITWNENSEIHEEGNKTIKNL
jgi:hypothetical protein